MADPYQPYGGGQRGGYAPASYGYTNDNQGYREPPERHPPAQAASSSTPNYRWWIPSAGIRRDVIQADIQRYLGPEALVRPGEGRDENRGRNGFWIAAYRTLTPAMIDDLRADSANFERSGDRGRYEDSMIHRSRQHWGPSSSVSQQAPVDPPSERVPSREPSTPYSAVSQTSSHGSGYSGYSGGSSGGYSADAQQATVPNYTHHSVQSSTAAATQYPAYPAESGAARQAYYDPRAPRSAAQHYSGEQPSQGSGYGASSTGHNSSSHTSGGHGASRPAAPPAGYYLASDGRYYPEAQRPT